MKAWNLIQNVILINTNKKNRSILIFLHCSQITNKHASYNNFWTIKNKVQVSTSILIRGGLNVISKNQIFPEETIDSTIKLLIQLEANEQPRASLHRTRNWNL